ncbi:AAA family ATPase, partial [Streptomyces sp. NPDC002920]
MFTSVDDVSTRLAETGYLASPAVATSVFLAGRLGKPLLVRCRCRSGRCRRRRRSPRRSGCRP